ncbi:MAG: site-specific integrase [bacterium]|nr:site-specific integrase [bacterium]
MALQDQLIKINIDNLDTKGLYFKDTNRVFTIKAIGKNDLKKVDYENIDIVLKFYFRNKQIKKTLKYQNITGLQAVKNAAAKRNELKEELETTGVLKKKSFKSLNELWDDYMEFQSKSLSEENIYTTQKSYGKWIKKSIGEMEVSKIMTCDIQNIVNDMLRQGKKPRTAQTIKQILRPLFNYSIDIGLSTTNPAIKVNLPSFDNTVNFELSEEKRKKLIEEIGKYEPLKYRGIMLFLYFGRRLNEALTLQWQNVQLEQNIYTIEAKYSKIRRKQDYPLIKPITDFLILQGVQKKGFIFEGEKTPHVTSNTFRRHWSKVLKNAGIEKMRVHDTRHVLGNAFVNKGESLENVGKLLGHSSVAVTKRYAKTSLQTADRLLNDYLE